MRASPERYKVASRIGVVARRQGTDAAELAVLRAELDVLRVIEIGQWAIDAMASLPSDDIRHVHREAARIFGHSSEAAR